jgi:hypothetical protein
MKRCKWKKKSAVTEITRGRGIKMVSEIKKKEKKSHAEETEK